MTACTHPQLRELSTAYGRWYWVRRPDGRYDIDGDYEIDDEDSRGFQCTECEAAVCLDLDGNLESAA